MYKLFNYQLLQFRNIYILLVFCLGCKTQTSEPHKASNVPDAQVRDMRMMFYNVENLFDTFDDTLKNDNDFMPEGSYFWTEEKYYRKLNRIAKVVVALGEWELPEIVCFAEIENRYVLEGLLSFTILKNGNYGIIHKESADKRGIDVALLYRKDTFVPLEYQHINLDKPQEDYFTREILYVKGLALKTDTFHIFVNHWSSRWGGELETEAKRMRAAGALKWHIDSIFSLNAAAKVVVVGDFNDTPTDRSIAEVLQAKPFSPNCKPTDLINLSARFADLGKGTHNFQGEWATLDQIIVSAELLKINGLHTSATSANVFDAPFLLTNDETHLGLKPYRTFVGFKYEGGFADHLPVWIDFYY